MKYYFRLDDACEHLDVNKWERIESIFDKYIIQPLVGIIPNCQDPSLLKNQLCTKFWEKTITWKKKGWIFALHGYSHVYDTENGGINPVHKRSEFAGKTIENQKKLIADGISILENHDINPDVFFAPSHTFDDNTLTALKECSKIRVISDTVASKRYFYKGFTIVPQQSGKVRKLPLFKEITFCYHPNMMEENDFIELENFIKSHRHEIYPFDISEVKRKRNIVDLFLSKLYFVKRKLHGKK